jgi:hypothetical protein
MSIANSDTVRNKSITDKYVPIDITYTYDGNRKSLNSKIIYKKITSGVAGNTIVIIPPPDIFDPPEPPIEPPIEPPLPPTGPVGLPPVIVVQDKALGIFYTDNPAEIDTTLGASGTSLATWYRADYGLPSGTIVDFKVSTDGTMIASYGFVDETDNPAQGIWAAVAPGAAWSQVINYGSIEPGLYPAGQPAPSGDFSITLSGIGIKPNSKTFVFGSNVKILPANAPQYAYGILMHFAELSAGKLEYGPKSIKTSDAIDVGNPPPIHATIPLVGKPSWGDNHPYAWRILSADFEYGNGKWHSIVEAFSPKPYYRSYSFSISDNGEEVLQWGTITPSIYSLTARLAKIGNGPSFVSGGTRDVIGVTGSYAHITDDDGRTWDQLQPPPGAGYQDYLPAVDPSGKYFFWASDSPIGYIPHPYFSYNAGATWTAPLSLPPWERSCGAFANCGSYLYWLAAYTNVLWSSDVGANWFRITGDLATVAGATPTALTDTGMRIIRIYPVYNSYSTY